MTKDEETPNSKKLSWADQVEAEDNEEERALPHLPPRQVIGPDENGIKKVIEYKFNEAGDMVKVTSTYQVRKVCTKTSKRAIQRRSWPKFGDAVYDEASSRLTTVSTEEIFLQRPSSVKEVEETKAREDALKQLGKRGKSSLVCKTRVQKGDHLTLRCPYKDLAPQSELRNYKRLSSAYGAATSSKANSSTYVPPGMRDGAKKGIGTDVRRRNEEYTVRVSNLSRYAQESDVHELFGLFGQIADVYVPRDHKPNLNRGFAFVNFVNKEDAQRAINKLDGYGYDNLILNVEWSLPRK
ncbi:hypothetical protein QUC31_011353 [Theobroma cacao]|nr:RNA recognition motif domain - like 10 [Theobroma cacao]